MKLEAEASPGLEAFLPYASADVGCHRWPALWPALAHPGFQRLTAGYHLANTMGHLYVQAVAVAKRQPKQEMRVLLLS